MTDCSASTLSASSSPTALLPSHSGPVPAPVALPNAATHMSIVFSICRNFLTSSGVARRDVEVGDGRSDRLNLSTRESSRIDCSVNARGAESV